MKTKRRGFLFQVTGAVAGLLVGKLPVLGPSGAVVATPKAVSALNPAWVNATHEMWVMTSPGCWNRFLTDPLPPFPRDMGETVRE